MPAHTQRSLVATIIVIGCSSAIAGGTSVRINEVRVEVGPAPQGGPLSNEVELYNPGPAAEDVGGYTLTGSEGIALAVVPPATVIPANGFVTVDLGTLLDADQDEVGLYPGAPGSVTIADYVAWSRSGPFDGGLTQPDAVAAGIWSAGQFVDRSAHGGLSTFGLAPDGFDHDIPEDWREFDWGIYFVSGGGAGPENPLQIAPTDGALLEEASPDLVWYSVGAASGYLLEVDDDPDFGSPEISLETGDTSFAVTAALPDGVYAWRVRVRDVGGTLVPEHRVWTFVKLWGVVLPTRSTDAPPKNLGGPIVATVPGFTPLVQHKDGSLLCLWNERIDTRPGCTERPSRNGPWDAAHPATAAHVPGCEHCRVYCTRAAIAMINQRYGGDLSQDRVSYRMFNTTRAQPEGDLGHWVGTNLNQRHPAYAWALQLAQGQIARLPGIKPPFLSVMEEVDAGRPIFIDGAGHATVLWGYAQLTVDGKMVRAVLIANPWPNQPGWLNYDTWQPDGFGWPAAGYFLLPTGVAIAGRMEEPAVTTDSDGDKVMDFDEGMPRALQSAFDQPDTDLDQVPDKNDIRNYTFHDSYHAGHNNNALNFSDIDGDGLRSENDCDSDAPDTVAGDGDFDGGEDIDGNGRNRVVGGPPHLRETCMFDPADFALAVHVDKDTYAVGEPVVLVDTHLDRPSHTFHANSTYAYEHGSGCPDKVNDTPLVHVGTFTTDVQGHAKPKLVHVCPAPGTYYLTVDVLGDHNYSEPDNHDPQTCWECLPQIFGYASNDGFANLLLRVPANSPTGRRVSYYGPTTFYVDYTTVGDADSDGRDDAEVEVTFFLIGHTPTLGEIELRTRAPSEHPHEASQGTIEETANPNPGALDVPPLNPVTGQPIFASLAAYLELEISESGTVLHAHDPLRLGGGLSQLPPGKNERLETLSTLPVVLYDDNENPAAQIELGFLMFDALRPAFDEPGYQDVPFGPGFGAKGLEASPGGEWGNFVYVADSAAGLVERVDPQGNVQILANGLGFPVGLAFSLELDAEFGDFLYTAEFGNDRISRIDPSGNVSTFASFANPGDLAFPPNGGTTQAKGAAGFEPALYAAHAFSGPIETVDGTGAGTFFSNLAGTYLQFGPGGEWGTDLHSTRHGGASTLTLNVPVGFPIPDAPAAPLELPVVYPQSNIINDLDVRVIATHPDISDLEIVIEHPDGTRVVLWDRTCAADGPYQDLDARFDDEGTAALCNSVGPTPDAGDGNGRFPPQGGQLAAFDGKDAAGQWTLFVTDHAAGNTGVLEQFSLIVMESSTGIATVASDGSHQLLSRGFVNPEGFDWAHGPGWGGDLFATDNTTGEIWRVRPDGSRTRFATLPDAADLAFHDCALYAVAEFGGCWRITSADDDIDGDGHGDACDTCAGVANPAQGPVVFGQTVLASDPDTFVWPGTADVAWVRGDLGSVGSYPVDYVQTAVDAISFTDTDIPGGGFYYIVKHDCPAGSWQTVRNAEPDRDVPLP